MDSLKNHLLIAMPSLNDGFFDRSVVYLCEHDAKGAMGLMINRPVGMSIRDLLAQLDLLPEEGILLSETRDQVLVGGPVNPERGFVLHTTQGGWANSSALTDELMLTTSRDILSSLGTHKAPKTLWWRWAMPVGARASSSRSLPTTAGSPSLPAMKFYLPCPTKTAGNRPASRWALNCGRYPARRDMPDEYSDGV